MTLGSKHRPHVSTGLTVLVAMSLSGCSNQLFYYSLVDSAQKEMEEGDFAESERLYKKAVQSAESLGKDDLRLVDVLERMAKLYSIIGRYTSARECLTRALTLREKEHPKRSFEDRVINHESVSPEDPDQELAGRLTDMYQIADCLFVEKRYDEALKVALEIEKKCEQAIKEKRSAYPFSFPHLLHEAKKVHASVAREKGNWDEAEKIYKEFIRDQEDSYFADSRIKTMLNLAVLYEMKGDKAAANQMYLRALLFQQQQDAPPTDLYKDINTHRIAMHFNKDVPSQNLIEQAISTSTSPDVEVAITETVKLTSEPSPFVLKELGKIYAWRGDHESAEKTLERAHQLFTQYEKTSDGNVQYAGRYLARASHFEVMQNLARVYRITNRKAEAQKVEQQYRAMKKEDEKSEKRIGGVSED